MAKNKSKIGLALGSGGARGLAHIGVIKVLEKNNIPIDFIAGGSIGALIGAHYALFKDIEKLENLVLSSDWRTAFKIFDPSLNGGFIAGKKIENLFLDWFENKKFKDLKIPFLAVATDLVTGKEVDIKRGSLAKAVRASISVPAIFQPVKYGKYLLSDAGISNPLPDERVREMGADFVVAVNLDAKSFGVSFKKENATIGMVSMRALNIMRYYLAKYSTHTADMVLEPNVKQKIDLVGWNQFFDTEKSKQIIQSGVNIANKHISKLKKILKK